MKQIIVVFACLIIAGCSSMNIPPKLNTPYFDKKGQLEVELGASTNSLYQNLGYSITDNISVISSGLVSYDLFDKNEYENYRRSEGVLEYLTPIPYEIKYIDLALGIYKSKNETFKSIYLGSGIGNSNYRYKYSSDGDQEYVVNNSYNTFFVQLNYGKKTGKLECGLTTRISYSFYPFSFEIINSIPWDNEFKTYEEYHIFGLQPCVYLNYTKNRFVFTANAGTYLTNHNKQSDWFIRDYPQNTLIHLSVGLKYRLGK